MWQSQQEKIIVSAKQISSNYQAEIETISQVFPTEETIMVFIGQLESQIQKVTPEYSFRFASVTPLTEGNKLYLLLSVTTKTDLAGLTAFLDGLEKLPFLTHVVSIKAKTPDSFANMSEIVVLLKIYVQNPFYTR